MCVIQISQVSVMILAQLIDPLGSNNYILYIHILQTNLHTFPLQEFVEKISWFVRVNRIGSRGRVQGVHPPPPPEMTCHFLIKLGILQNMHMCMICIFSSSHDVTAWSKAFFIFAFKICLHHQSVTPLLSLHPLLRKLLDPPLVKTIEITRLMIRMMSQFVFLCLLHVKLKFH